jgi:hypothetical protein
MNDKKKTDADDEQEFMNRTKKKTFHVSGRDDTLLRLLAHKMNFKFEYVDVKMIEMNSNVTTADGSLALQMLQKRVSYFCFHI